MVWYGIVYCSGEGHKAYVIPAGGSSTLGAWGYIDAFSEMIQQVYAVTALSALLRVYTTRFFCPFSSVGTIIL